jgi:hypothetical protein
MVIELGCFNEETSMTPRARSISGAVMAILTVPLIVGLLACLPVPIGDPEKSTIDKEMTGMWMKLDEEDVPSVVLFEPYDKRGWLVTMFGFRIDDEVCETGDDEPESFAEIMSLLRSHEEDCLNGTGQWSYKAWRTKLGDHWFMTWEPKALFDVQYGFEPEYWFGFRLDKAGPDNFTLRMIDIDSTVFNEIDSDKSVARLSEEERPRDSKTLRSARRVFERVIRRNADNDTLYNENSYSFHRIAPGDYKLFVDSLVPDGD